MQMHILVAALALATGSALPMAAQTAAPAHEDHATMDHAGDSAATTAYKAAMDRMMAEMAMDYSGNPDVDFARGMIPHHRAAVEMAQVQLAHGTDPEMRKLAEAVIASQEAEIALMQGWLARQAQ